MRIRLKYKSISGLPEQLLATLVDPDRLKAMSFDRFFAEVGTDFTVYGIEFFGGNVFYRVPNPPKERYSILCLGTLFEIVDPHLSIHWQCRTLPDGKVAIWPPSWFEGYYHDRLSEGDPAIVEDFVRVKALLDYESRAVRLVPDSS